MERGQRKIHWIWLKVDTKIFEVIDCYLKCYIFAPGIILYLLDPPGHPPSYILHECKRCFLCNEYRASRALGDDWVERVSRAGGVHSIYCLLSACPRVRAHGLSRVPGPCETVRKPPSDTDIRLWDSSLNRDCTLIVLSFRVPGNTDLKGRGGVQVRKNYSLVAGLGVQSRRQGGRAEKTCD